MLCFYVCSDIILYMPHKRLDAEEWCCQYCHAYKDADYDKVVYHELTEHHAGCPANQMESKGQRQ
jgi:hypothetical protein